ncbi:S-adenosyl-L-methionine-dependent methyltransferase [Lentithecium fluviatile CBS 122367]|uniref:S-adenosyl-L-methionine-dependent methyltransferase n=1 Tax=Lentithecium fluviatile CBS 122367 TaxID=1168545 RepID=A0A6G1IG74_9PLEO|nr:S-adenosyl-L-methionine-dependent methyltransferase [Lentithecium fluviatile CBS 122367]
MAGKSLLAPLEQLRDLIDASIVTLQKNEEELRETPVSLDALELHPIHQSTSTDVRKALKTISSSSQMLRALTDPQTFLNDIFMGFHDGTALLVCVEADVANVIGNTEMHVDEIANRAGIESDKLARYMRNLCNSHVFREISPNIFANTSLSGLVREEGKRAHVAHCLDLVRRSSCKAWEALKLPEFKNSNAPGKTAFNLAYNTDLEIFQYLSEVEPEIGKRTKVAFASGTKVNTDEFLGVYPWAREGNAKIVDVGGGVGGGTMPVIKAFKDLRLVVQDIPDTHPNFERIWNEEYPDAIKEGRVKFAAHDFFTPQTEEGDIYFMRHVIHDWPDAESAKILANTAAKMTSSTKLLICEHVVLPSYRLPPNTNSETGPDGDDFVAPEPLLANWGAAHTSRLDLQVLACLNSRQRTQAQYMELLQRAGLEAVHVWRNMGPLVIIECRKLG